MSRNFTGKVDLPKINKKRSYFDLGHTSHIDMNVGLLYPLDKPWHILPGDSFDVGHTLQIRMTNPPKTPTMDQLVLDIFFFYCPYRILWDGWDEFITGDTGTDYTHLSSTTIPVIEFDFNSGKAYDLHFSVLDYLGVNVLEYNGSNTLTDKAYINMMPVNGYYYIYNEYFRYQSLQDPVLWYKNALGFKIYTDIIHKNGSGVQDFNFYTDPFNDSKYNATLTQVFAGLSLMRVNRLPDYFSRCLPQPQAGPDVKIFNDFILSNPLFGETNGSQAGQNVIVGANNNPGALGSSYYDYELYGGSGLVNYLTGTLNSVDNSIRSLSQAFALNKLLYIDNVYGRRITEWTYGHFGVTVPDDRVQRPEFITKRRIYININQIMQSSETTSTSPQGNAGAWSVTLDKAKDFVKSFVEFGCLYSLGCIRVLNHTYAQGIDRDWSKISRFEFFMPEFVNVGDQLTLSREIYYKPTTTSNFESGFAYQERNAEYKFGVSRVAGWLRPDISGSLAIWTYTDSYNSTVSFTEEWMREPIANVDRTLYLDHTVAPQFLLDVVWNIDSYRTMPRHSIPGGLTGGM